MQRFARNAQHMKGKPTKKANEVEANRSQKIKQNKRTKMNEMNQTNERTKRIRSKMNYLIDWCKLEQHSQMGWVFAICNCNLYG